ncbi:hypothetical protein [Streptomyces sp. CC53]|uniref:hypothetical protein n=1 Tax=Streptomyces sp. CC53 TaxID=1906740 RepID=UPI00115F9143|nr:hypothetical protein [Streptomyces sp. CC53]
MNYRRLALLVGTPAGVAAWYGLWVVLFSTVISPMADTNAWGSAVLVALLFTGMAVFVGAAIWTTGLLEEVWDWLHECGCKKQYAYGEGRYAVTRPCKRHRHRAAEDRIRELEKELGL